MKRTITIVLIALITSLSVNAAMSNSRMRKEARFLTDKMAYELSLTNAQYDNVYEINYDFIASVRYILDDVARGYSWARRDYDESLTLRNADLRYVLSRSQYNQFRDLDRFYRPLYVDAGKWMFRIYHTYHNRNHFYYPKPHHYNSYAGKPHPDHHMGKPNKPAPRPEMKPNKPGKPNNHVKPATPNRNDKPGYSGKPNNNSKPQVDRPSGNNRPKVDKPNNSNRRNDQSNTRLSGSSSSRRSASPDKTRSR